MQRSDKISPPIARTNSVLFALLMLANLMVAILMVGCSNSAQMIEQEEPEFLRLDPVLEAADFTLQHGPDETVSITDFRGDIVIMTFGFTHCPDVCPTTLSIWKKVYAQLGAAAGRVHFMFISVDPERDTPELMAAFVGQFDDRFYGLTGTLEQIEDIAGDYSISFRKVSYEEVYGSQEGVEYGPEDYFVQHSAITYLINADGQLALVFPYNTNAEVIVTGIQEYLE